MFADTVDVIEPFEFEEPELFAFQFHDAILFPFPFTPPWSPTVNPSVPKAVSPLLCVVSAPFVSDFNLLVTPLTAS